MKELRVYLKTEKITEKQIDELNCFLVNLFDTTDIFIDTETMQKEEE